VSEARRRTLGEQLRHERGERWSLRGLAGEARVGLGYLHRLERDQVQAPGPRQLAKVARVLDPDGARGTYATLMRLAGYTR
jgi:hypothetical protein